MNGFFLFIILSDPSAASDYVNILKHSLKSFTCTPSIFILLLFLFSILTKFHFLFSINIDISYTLIFLFHLLLFSLDLKNHQVSFKGKVLVSPKMKGSGKWSENGEKRNIGASLPLPGHVICFNLMETAKEWEIACMLKSEGW